MRRPSADNEMPAEKVLAKSWNGIDSKSPNQQTTTLLNHHEQDNNRYMRTTEEMISGECHLHQRRNLIPREVQMAVDSVLFIAEHLKQEDRENSVSENMYAKRDKKI